MQTLKFQKWKYLKTAEINICINISIIITYTVYGCPINTIWLWVAIHSLINTYIHIKYIYTYQKHKYKEYFYLYTGR